MYPFNNVRIRLFVHFYPHRTSIHIHQRADKINSYVAQKMYAFPIADGDATCRMCSKEERGAQAAGPDACDLIQVRTYGRRATDQCTRELNISVFFEIGGEPLQWPRWIFFIHLYQRLH
jgi:hypothetical protein